MVHRPLQRTRTSRAAERNAPRRKYPWGAEPHPDRPSRGLQGVQRGGQGTASRAPGYAVPDSNAVLPASPATSSLGATREGGTQGRAGIEPASPWPALRGKCYALNITGCYAKCRQSPTQLAWCRHRSGLRPPRPAGSRNPCYVWRPCAPAARPLICQCVAAPEKPVCVLALRASTRPNPRTPPAQAVGCAGLQPCGLPAPCSPPSFPSAPPAGLPKVKGHPGTRGELPPFAQGA